MGEGCKKAGRRCSVEKHFDLVDVENLAFNNLYIEDQEIANPHSKVKVSRYPRTTMPHELKNRFEIDIKTGHPDYIGGTSMYENLYDD